MATRALPLCTRLEIARRKIAQLEEEAIEAEIAEQSQEADEQAEDYEHVGCSPSRCAKPMINHRLPVQYTATPWRTVAVQHDAFGDRHGYSAASVTLPLASCPFASIAGSSNRSIASSIVSPSRTPASIAAKVRGLDE